MSLEDRLVSPTRPSLTPFPFLEFGRLITQTRTSNIALRWTDAEPGRSALTCSTKSSMTAFLLNRMDGAIKE